jgi:hypothetical protein
MVTLLVTSFAVAWSRRLARRDIAGLLYGVAQHEVRGLLGGLGATVGM